MSRSSGLERSRPAGGAGALPAGPAQDRQARGAGTPGHLLALGALLIAYGNTASLVLGVAGHNRGAVGAALGLLLVAAVLLWARRVAHLDWADLGLTGVGATHSAWIGLLVAVAMVVPSLLILRFPPLVGGPVTYTPLAGLPWGDLLGRVLVSMPLDTILPEEVAFRGVLLGALRQRYPAAQAVVLAAVPFALWHGVLVGRTLELTNLAGDPLLFSLGLLGAFAAVFLGGVLFGILRLATGHLAGSLAAHWGFNAALLFGLQALHR